jgi:hypothetical protein
MSLSFWATRLKRVTALQTVAFAAPQLLAGSACFSQSGKPDTWLPSLDNVDLQMPFATANGRRVTTLVYPYDTQTIHGKYPSTKRLMPWVGVRSTFTSLTGSPNTNHVES